MRDTGIKGDTADQANRYVELEIDVAVKNAQASLNSASQLVLNGSVVCRECKDKIPVARLLALPNASLCLVCARLAEAYNK